MRRYHPLEEVLVIGLAFLAGVMLVMHCLGCAGAQKDAADATYLSQQLKCIDDNQTKNDIDACRAAVKAAWSIDAGRDAK